MTQALSQFEHESNLKTIIIIIFIVTCLTWIILELRVFYNDILEIKTLKKKLSLKTYPLYSFYFESVKVHYKIV
jgi:hypothetical protein